MMKPLAAGPQTSGSGPTFTQEELDAWIHEINNRPRKVLNRGHTRRSVRTTVLRPKNPSTVALPTRSRVSFRGAGKTDRMVPGRRAGTVKLVKKSNVRRALLNSPLGWVASQLKRASWAIKNVSNTCSVNIYWFFTSKEHTNFTYPLTGVNRRYLAHFVSNITGSTPAEVFELFDELESDISFSRFVEKTTAKSSRRWFADSSPKLGRRLGWYAIVRIVKPQLVVETGTDKGLGALVIHNALAKNRQGTLVTMDSNPDAGYLIAGLESDQVQIAFGDSVELLSDPGFPAIDIFIHDSLHTYKHEMAEFSVAFSKMRHGGILISDDSECQALLDFADSVDWEVHYFREQPVKHPHPGAGIALACAGHSSPAKTRVIASKPGQR